MLNFVSDQTLDQIKKHLSKEVENAERKRHSFFKSNEEYVTSAILERLATSEWQKSESVKWRVQVHKTGNHGKTAESEIGADGIIQIAVYDKGGRLLETKGLLFQAKKTTNKDKTKLEEQIQDMKNVAGGKACAVFIYDEESGFFAKGVNEFRFEDLKNRGTNQKLHSFISNDFLDCKVGVKGLRFDWRTGELYRPQIELKAVEPTNIWNAATIEVRNNQ